MNAKTLLLHSFLPCLLTVALPGCGSSSDDAPPHGAAAGGSAGEAGTGGTGTGGTSSGGSNSTGGVGSEGGMGGEATGTGGAENAFHGKVVDGAGAGVQGAKVLLEGHVYTTAADGSFEAKDVGKTYDLIVFPAGGGVSIWKNGTEREPVAIVPVEHKAPSVHVSGTISGGSGFPNPAGTQTLVGFDCGDGHRVGGAVVTFASFGVDVTWEKWGPAKCRLMALEQKGSTYSAFASREISLDDSSAPISAQDLELQPIATTHDVYVRHVTGGGYTSVFGWGPFAASTDNLVYVQGVFSGTAKIPDLSIPLWSNIEKDNFKATRRTVGVDFVSLDLTQGISGMSPANDAIVAPDAELSVTVPAGVPGDPFAVGKGIFELDFTLASGTKLILHTADEKFTLPDLSALGVDVLGKTTWTGTYSNNAGSVDTLLSSDPLPDYSVTAPAQTFTFEAKAKP